MNHLYFTDSRSQTPQVASVPLPALSYMARAGLKGADAR